MAAKDHKKAFIITGAVLAIITVILVIRKLNTPVKAAAAAGLTPDQINQVKSMITGLTPATKTVAKPATTTSTPKASTASKISSVINPPTYDIGDNVWAKKDMNATAVQNDVIISIPFLDSDYIGTFDGLIGDNNDIAWIKTDSGIPDNDHYAVALANIYN